VSGAAFFDLDRTLIRRSSALALAGAFRDRGLISRRQLASAALWQLLFAARGADAEAVRRAAEDGLAVLRGFRPEEMRHLVAQALEPVLRPLVYREPFALVERHRSRGERVYIVSTALQEIVDAIAADLGFDGALGTICEVSGGMYTGRSLRPLHGEGKADAVRDLARREGIDLSLSTAYSDSVSDLPFLEAVGTPVAVNPDRGLRRLAREREWQILEFSERAFSPARRRFAPVLVGVPVVLGAAAYAYRRRAA
jgi:HAD superfamily hydrolase (TIGR01490 family)